MPSPVRAYFSLQYTLNKRNLTHIGVPPLLVYGLALLGFFGLSYLLFYRASFAIYIYYFVLTAILIQLSTANRNVFLRAHFSTTHYRVIRLCENAIATIPFFGFLLFNTAVLYALPNLLLAFVFSFVQHKPIQALRIPTPFYKKPFEYSVGFRKTILLLLFSYSLYGIAVGVHNYNLSAFCVLLIFFICINYHLIPENSFYVWVHKHNTHSFLLYKIKTAWLYASFLIVPVVIGLVLFFPGHLGATALVCCAGYSLLLVSVLLKYASFPHSITITHSILFALCIAMPPLVVVAIPYLYSQAVKTLIPYLYDTPAKRM